MNKKDKADQEEKNDKKKIDEMFKNSPKSEGMEGCIIDLVIKKTTMRRWYERTDEDARRKMI